MSTVVPNEGTEIGTIHRLKCGKSEDVFEWRGDAWGLPENPYQTKAAAMWVLGWRYVRPVGAKAETTKAEPDNVESL